MKNMDRKEIIQEYKNRKITGGVYRILNTKTNKFLLGSTKNLQGIINRFNFSKSTDSCVEMKLENEWKKYKAESFIIEILEQIDKKPEQEEKEFADDIKTLEEIWREKLGTENEY